MSKFRTLLYSNYERVVSAGETPNFLVSWVVAIICRSQHICLFSESRDVNAVNVGTVLEDLRLILCVEFMNFMLETLCRAHDMCINLFQSKLFCNNDTSQVPSIFDLAFTPCSRHVLHSVRHVGVRHLSLKIGRDAIKIRGEIPHLIPNQNENIKHIHYTLLKIVYSIVLSSN